MNAREAIHQLQTIPPKEPVFVLRAEDVLAPLTIEAWADAAEASGVAGSLCSHARMVARRMMRWPIRRLLGRNDNLALCEVNEEDNAEDH